MADDCINDYKLFGDGYHFGIYKNQDATIGFELQNRGSYPNYRKTSSINGTKSQDLNVSCILLQLPSLNPLKPGVKLGMKM